MKYFAAIMMLVSAGFLVYDWIVGMYMAAMIQAVCLYINHCTYCNAVEQEKKKKEQDPK